jgi:hypothetical protein
MTIESNANREQATANELELGPIPIELEMCIIHVNRLALRKCSHCHDGYCSACINKCCSELEGPLCKKCYHEVSSNTNVVRVIMLVCVFFVLIGILIVALLGVFGIYNKIKEQQ